MLVAENLSKRYGDKVILDGACFAVAPSELISIVGPSGEGKSTIARILCGTVKPDAGAVCFENQPIFAKNGAYNGDFHRKIQLIPQQPFASLDPRQRVGAAICEPLLHHKMADGKAGAKKRALELMAQMQLDAALYDRRPGELSGGQAQRVLIARALTVSPRLLIADEATSMLDMTSQAQIIRIFKQLIDQRQLSVLLISHDWPLVQSISDRIYRLSDGKLLEMQK